MGLRPSPFMGSQTYNALWHTGPRTNKGDILQTPLVGGKVTHWEVERMVSISIVAGFHNTELTQALVALRPCHTPADVKDNNNLTFSDTNLPLY